MAVLVLADHDGSALTQPTRSTIAAAAQLGEVHVLLAGENLGAVAAAAARTAKVAKVLLAEDARYAHRLAEPLAALPVALHSGYTHLLAPGSAAGKNRCRGRQPCWMCSRSPKWRR